MHEFALRALCVCVLSVLFSGASLATAQQLAVNRASTVCAQDQADREKKNSDGSDRQINWPEIRQRDKARRSEMRELLAAGEIRSAADFYCAAVVFQHGDTVDEIRLAYSLATISSSLDPSSEVAKYMSAAAWDRIMLKARKPQWYGTQFIRQADGGGWSLYKFDETAVSDEERAAFGVPSVAETYRELDEKNKKK